MDEPAHGEITELLLALSCGEASALYRHAVTGNQKFSIIHTSLSTVGDSRASRNTSSSLLLSK
jgi:hypothetical protein